MIDGSVAALSAAYIPARCVTRVDPIGVREQADFATSVRCVEHLCRVAQVLQLLEVLFVLLADGVAFLFDLLAQTIHNILEQDRVAIAISAPDRFDDLLEAKHKARTAHQQMQQAKLEIGQPDFAAFRIDKAAPRRIEAMPADFDKAQAFDRQGPAAPHPGQDLRQEYGWADRLNDHVIYPGVIGFKDLGFVIGGQEKQNGSYAFRSEFMIELYPLLMPGIQVDDHQIRRLR